MPRDDKFYTGFSDYEIVEIARAIRKSYSDGNSMFSEVYDQLLPKRIYNRLTTDQVDLIDAEQPRLTNDIARVLAQGKTR